MDVISLEENLPMRKNNTLLAAAIAATFVVSMNASYAGLANYPLCSGPQTDIANNLCSQLYVDPNIGNVVPISDNDQGVIYGTHLFGDTGNNITLPSVAGGGYAAAKWIIEGTPKGRMQLMATIEGAEFKIDSATDTSMYPKLLFNSTSGTVDPTGQGTYSKTCSSNQCTWRFGDLANTSLVDKDEFYIVYQITKAGSTLATEGGQVKMMVKIGTVTDPTIIAAEETIAIATSKEPFKVNFQSTNNNYIKVSVAADNKAFLTQVPTSLGQDADKDFINTKEVIFGYMSVTPAEDLVKADDGYTLWKLGDPNTTNEALKVESGTTLTINEVGQFNASMTGSNGGSVYLYTAAGRIAATTVNGTDAIWTLSDGNINNIFKGIGISSQNSKYEGRCTATPMEYVDEACVPIIIQADGTNQINVPPEDGPKAELNLSYLSSNSMKDIKYPSADAAEQRLAKYSQDGISCWVFNVPFVGAIDQFNLRIINDSSTTSLNTDGTLSTDCVQGTLYGPDGTEIGKEALGCPPAGGALYIGTEEMKAKYSGFPSTTGRGSMFITSTLQKMEVLAMTRFRDPPCYDNKCGGKSPLTNISTGSHGVACAPNYR